MPSFDGPRQLTSASAIVREPGGRIVLGGAAGAYRPDFGLVRLQSEGALDRSFGWKGLVVTDFSGSRTYDSLRELILAPDGRLIAAGDVLLTGRSTLVLARYHTGAASGR